MRSTESYARPPKGPLRGACPVRLRSSARGAGGDEGGRLCPCVGRSHSRLQHRCVPSPPPETTAPRRVASVDVSYGRAQRHERCCWMAARSSRALRPRAPTRTQVDALNLQSATAFCPPVPDASCRALDLRPMFGAYGHACRATPCQEGGRKLLLVAVLPPVLRATSARGRLDSDRDERLSHRLAAREIFELSKRPMRQLLVR